MIELKKLTEADKGRKVIFTYHHGERVEGELSSWNEKFVFVRFRAPNGQACDPSMCEFSLPRSHEVSDE